MLAMFVATAQAYGAAEPAETVTVEADETVMDEITVTAPRLKTFFFHIPNVEFLIKNYRNRGIGADHYNRGRYEEAFPHLLASAQQGFKMAQARVGYLYLAGLGTERDVETGIVWISLAAQYASAPEIRMYRRALWEKIPAHRQAELHRRIDEFDAVYGARVNRVGCTFDTTTSSRVKKLYCRYMDQCRFAETEATPELLDCPGEGMPPP